MKNVNRTVASVSLVISVLALGCGGDSKGGVPSPINSTGGRGGGGGGGSGGSAGMAGSGGAGGATDAPKPPPVDAASVPDAAAFAPTPSNLPVLVFDLPGIPIETVGEQKVPGNLSIIESQTTPAGAPTKIGLALYPTVASPGSISIELRDAADKPRTEGLLGLPYQGDWIVQACGAADKPCLRNLLGFNVGAQLVTGAPKARLVEVYYNQEYKGLFQLIAPATKEQGRVDIPEPAADGTGEAISGGYVIRRQGLGASLPTAMPLLDFLSMVEEPGMFPHRLIYSYLFPKPASLTAAQKTYIEGYVAMFETAMKAANFADPNLGYRSWIDVPSFSDFFIFNEVSHNIDGYWKNIVLTKQRDMGATRGKLSITPFWDFSIAFGEPELRSGWRTDKLSFDAANSALNSSPVPGGECTTMEWPLPRGAPLCGANCCLPTTVCRLPEKCWNMPYRPFWWERIQSDTAFRNDTRCRYRALRNAGGALDMARLDTLINEWKTQLAGGAYTRHLERVPALRDFAYPFNPYRMDPRTAPDPLATPAAFLDKEVKWFRDWVEARLKWLDDNLPGVCASVNETPRDGGPGPDGGPPLPDTLELTRGLVGYWKFDELTGMVAKDSSPLMNNGTLMRFSSADWLAARVGGGLNYTPALSPVVVVTDSPSLNPTTGLSIGAWIKASDWAGNRRIAQKGDNDDQYRLTAEAGVLKFHLSGVTNGSLEAILPAPGAFHHVVGTFDGQRIRIYIDGVVAAQEDAAVGAINVTPFNLHIGIKRVGAPQVDSFSGVLDEVVMYDRALNPTEVRRLSQGGRPVM